MKVIFTYALILVIIASCTTNPIATNKPQNTSPKDSLTEMTNTYSSPTKKQVYSTFVKDTFTVFESAPSDYNKDSAKTYPLIILLDANAFFEPLLADIKFNTLIGNVGESIIAGVGYKDFPSMDSLRSRDYTYPVAIPEYEMALSGGAPAFKNFIDKELVPQIKTAYKIDTQKIILCGHSLGGYFVLYYMLQSAKEGKYTATNFVSASPSLHYNHRYLFDMEKQLYQAKTQLQGKLYISMGSRDMQDAESKNILGDFASQFKIHQYKALSLKADEYSNFGHIDAALPGFIKGLTYVFEEKK